MFPIVKERAKICADCGFNTLNLCTKCSCFIPAKITGPNSECPQHKWHAVTKEQLEANNQTNDNRT